MEFKGHIQEGVVVFEGPVTLPDGTAVVIRVDEPNGSSVQTPPESLWDVLGEFAGTVEGPADWAENHDHYIYGAPKRL